MIFMSSQKMDAGSKKALFEEAQSLFVSSQHDAFRMRRNTAGRLITRVLTHIIDKKLARIEEWSSVDGGKTSAVRQYDGPVFEISASKGNVLSAIAPYAMEILLLVWLFAADVSFAYTGAVSLTAGGGLGDASLTASAIAVGGFVFVLWIVRTKQKTRHTLDIPRSFRKCLLDVEHHYHGSEEWDISLVAEKPGIVHGDRLIIKRKQKEPVW